MKKIILAIVAMFSAALSFAQNSQNSPYTQYGLGSLDTQANSFSRGMSGVGIGWRSGQNVNFQNPASYASIDSLSFLFDAGISGRLTNYDDGRIRKNAYNSSFDYVTAGFRAHKGVGVSFGLVQYSSIGYKYFNSRSVNETTPNGSNATTCTSTYSGDGGLHQVYLGVGVDIVPKWFSLGANISYLWGGYTKGISNTFDDSSINTLQKVYTSDVRSYKLDLGAQVMLPIAKKHHVNLGGVYSLGHNLGATAVCTVTNLDSQSSSASTTNPVEIEDALSIPDTWGVGVQYCYNNQLSVGFDYRQQLWGNIEMPRSVADNATGKERYELQKGLLRDSETFGLGVEFCENPRGMKFAQRVRYRAGVSYSTPYVMVNGLDGPKDLTVSAGVGVPILNRNTMTTRSIVNLSVAWSRRSADKLIKENTFLVNVGLTFNERWFAKWKLE